MTTQMQNSGMRSYGAMLLIVAVLYMALGALGLGFAIAPGYASPIFPAAGFAVAILLWSDRRAWPGVWAGSFALNLGVAWLNNELGWHSGLIAAGIACGATAQALAAWWLVIRSVKQGWQTLETVSDIIRCLTLAGPIASAISASMGITLLFANQLIPGSEVVFAWLNWCSGDTLGVLVMLPLSLTLLYRRTPSWHGRLLTLVVPMLVTLILVSTAFFSIAKWESTQQKLDIKNHGEVLARRLEQRFIAHAEALSALRRLFEVTPNMTNPQFEYFTRITLKDNPDLFALSINPFVRSPQRPSFERIMAEKTGMSAFEIKERDGQGKLIRAGDRPDYVAVGFIAPLQGNSTARGFDINSEPIRHDAINRAKSSGELAVTAPIQLVQENQKRVGVLLMHPAYKQEGALNTQASQSELMAFTVGVIKVDKMVQIATRDVAVPGLVFSLTDPLAASDRSNLYRSNLSEIPSEHSYVWQKPLLMADRTWTLSVFPTASYLRQNRHWTALIVGATGLLLSALLQVLLLVTTGSTAIVKRKVHEQTSELQAKSNALADRNAQMDAMFILSPDGFVAFAHDNSVKFVNPAFLKMTGISLDRVIGQNETNLEDELRKRCESPDDFPAITSCFGVVGETLPYETLTLKLPRPSVLQMVGIRSESSAISRILYFRDVTHETEVDQMKSEFLSTAAHELRTPMASIYGFSEVLLTQELDEASRQEFLSIIFKQSELMASILNELLDLARIEARRGKDFIFETTLLQTLVYEVVSEFNVTKGRSEPILTLPATPLYIVADHQKMQQCLLNVLSNAYKYSSEGTEVLVELIASTEDHGTVPRAGIRIVDHGIGMTPAQLGRVFERFYRADTSGKVPGTGLGMSIVKEIVVLHDGQIELSSHFGEGTIVTLWFPMLKN